MQFTNRVPFDKYEAAILLILYLQTLNNRMSRHQAIEECSTKLRKIAQNKGMKIDDSFRSVSGITYQMSCMEAVYQGKSDKPKLFVEMVRKYKEERNVFEELLKDAEQMSEENNEINQDREGLELLSRAPNSVVLDKSTSAESSGTTQDFFKWLLNDQKLSEVTARSYSSAINTCDMLCREKQIGTGKLINADSDMELNNNIKYLTELTEFQSRNSIQHYRLTAALEKYATFFKEAKKTARSEPETSAKECELISPEEISRIRTTLSEPRFEYGFKNDSVELSRFRESYNEINGTDCTLDDDQLGKTIDSIGFSFNGKIYIISDYEKSRIKTYLKKYEEQGIHIIYYSALYDMNFEEYDAEKIVSSEMLKAIIMELCPQYTFRNYYFAFRKDHITEVELISDDIVRVWGSEKLQKFIELAAKLPLIPCDKIKSVLSQSKDFLSNSHEIYVRRKSIYIPEDELKKVVDCIEENIKTYDRALFDDLPLANLRKLNSQISENTLRNAVYKLIEDKYDRNDKILTRKGESEDIYTAIVNYCEKSDKCTYDELESIAKTVSGVIKQPDIVDAANSTMIRIDKDHFVADGFVDFDVAKIDNALAKIVKNEFIGMKEVTTFVNFPYCGYGWNLYLLESYCRRFSKKYRYKTRRANSSNSGAIVCKECQLNYHDLMAHAIARAKVNLTEDEVFDYLTETGYIERKRYRSMGPLIREAADLRS